MSKPDIGSAVESLPESLDPAAAFSLLGNETRIRILQALWRADDRPVSFSDLRREIGVRDSAQFNYHLGKLTDHFVRKTEDGYDFRYAGEKVVRAILAGTFTDHVEAEFPAQGACHSCNGDLTARYADERMTIACDDCGAHYGRYPFPPGGLNDREACEVMEAFDQSVRHLHCLAADGVCPECGGRVETTIKPDEEDFLGLDIRVDHRCQQCRHVIRSPVGLSLLDNSTVVSFYSDHGRNVCRTPYWTLEWCVTPEQTAVHSRDPWQVEITIPAGDEVISVTVDGDLQVVETSRTRHDPEGDQRSIA